MTALVPIPQPVTVTTLDSADEAVLRQLVQRWLQKSSRNLLRTRYYDGKNRLKDLGIAIPPQLKTVETVVGWPAKAVDLLAQRINFDGFVSPDTSQDPYDLGILLAQNRFDVELPQGIRSALTHSTAFISTIQGDVQSGQPEVLTIFRSALWGTGLWDATRRELSAALTVAQIDDNGQPTEMVLHFPDRVGILEKRGGQWVVAWRRNPVGRVLVEPLRCRPDLDRPFGRSRISRAVMSITDAAVRTVLRSEVSAEFFTSPQRYVLGADEDTFFDGSGNPIPAWQAIIGRLFTVSRDDNGEIPTMGQFPQASMQPHDDMLRTQATRFAGETGIPVSSLGVIQDNPPSAEGIHATREDLIVEAESAMPVFGSSLVRVAQNMVALRDGLSEIPAEMYRLEAKFRRADRPSKVSAADAALKEVQAIPDLAESDVLLEELGYDQAQIMRIRSDIRRARGSGLVVALTQQPEPTVDNQG